MAANRKNPGRKNQSGATLITALVMLVALTLLVVSGIRSSNTNLRIAGNMQMQEEAVTAAQQAIEQTISTNFTTSINAAAVAVDIDDNGTTDYTAQVAAPVCTSSVQVTGDEINKLNAADQDCTDTDQAGMGGGLIDGPDGPTPPPQTVCLNQTWDIQSTVADNRTGANAVVHQGVFVRVKAGTACP